MAYSTSTTPIPGDQQRSRLTRARWAAIGAAVAVSVGAGGFGFAQATVDSGPMPVYIAIIPCRLVDTRPQFQVGERAAPLNQAETYTLVGTGSRGNCNIPAGVTSLATNVTALNATAPTFLRFAPGNSVPPGEGSSLNPVPGQPPTPNAVTTSIDAEGEFSVFNLAGTVDMIIDVVGYFDDHVHASENPNPPGIVAFADAADEAMTDVEEVVASVQLRPPSSGFVQVSASIEWSGSFNDTLRCSATDGATGHTTDVFLDSTGNPRAHTFPVQATFAVEQFTGPSNAGQSFNIVCNMFPGQTGTVGNVGMSAIFLGTSYAPT